MSDIEMIKQSAVAAIGALILTATSVGAVVEPAWAVEFLPQSAAVQETEQAPA